MLHTDPGTDSTTVENHLSYHAFGQVIAETDAAVDFLFGFTGRERDEESDLQFNRARHYDAAVGRWISEDPIGFNAKDANVNRYAGNQPANKIDPSGLFPPAAGLQYIDPETGNMWLPIPRKFDITRVGSSPTMSLAPNSPNGAGAYADVWIDLPADTINVLTEADGGYLVEKNTIAYEIYDFDTGELKDSKDRTLWFLTYYLKNAKGNLVAHLSHREHGDLKQYKQLLNWDLEQYGLEKLKCTKGSISVTSEFSLFPKGAGAIDRGEFGYSHDEGTANVIADNPLTGQPEIVHPATTVGEDASGFPGDYIDEVGYIADTSPWRKEAGKPIGTRTVSFTFDWVWRKGQEPTVNITGASGIPGGPEHTSTGSNLLVPGNPVWE